jgi:hypothetical protein
MVGKSCFTRGHPDEIQYNRMCLQALRDGTRREFMTLLHGTTLNGDPLTCRWHIRGIYYKGRLIRVEVRGWELPGPRVYPLEAHEP